MTEFDENVIQDFMEVFNRLGRFRIATQQDLARSLKITQSAVSDAKKKGKIPPEMGRKIKQEI